MFRSFNFCLRIRLAFFILLLPVFVACSPYHSGTSSLSGLSGENESPVSDASDDSQNGEGPSSEAPPVQTKSLCDDLSADDFQFEREEVCKLISNEREQRGLQPMELDAQVSLVAQKYAKLMYDENFFSHSGPDGSSPGDRLAAEGVVNYAWGENIAEGYTTPDSVMRGWMNSSGHRANILDRQFDKVGVGFYRNYWVQVFIKAP